LKEKSMVDAVLLPLGQQQFFDANGEPLAAGTVTFYVPNTNTLKNTWQDPEQVTLNTNPVVLDASGSATIYGNGTYVQVVKDVSGAVLWTKLTGTSIINPTLDELGGAALAGDNIWTGTNQFNNTVTMFEAAMDWAEAPPIASDTVINLQTMAGNKGSITVGTANPIEEVTLNQGAIRFMRFSTDVSLLAGPQFVMPEGLTLAKAGDCCIFEGEAGGRVRISIYQRKDGGPVSSSAVVGSQYSSIQGTSRGLVIVATAGAPSGTVVAEALTVMSSSLAFATGRNLALTFNTSVVGLNGLDAGTVAADTWYAVYVISNGTGTFGTLLSTSGTAPTLPTGYTFATRVGWVRTSGTAAQFRGSKQVGNVARWVVDGVVLTGLPRMLDVNQGSPSAPTWVAMAIGAFAPSTATRIVVVLSSAGGAETDAIVAPSDEYGGSNSTTNPPVGFLSKAGAVQADLVLESTNIYGATGSTARIYSNGWIDV